MRRLLPSLIGVCLAVGAFAQTTGYLGTKTGSTLTDSGAQAGGPGIGSFFQMLIALGIVLLLLKLVLPKLAGKLNKRIVTSATSTLSIEESANFAGGNLYIVRAKSKTLLLSATSSGVTCLADLSEPQASEQQPTFEEIVETAKPYNGEHPKSLEVDQPSQETGDPIHATLQRLERLAR